MNPMIPLLTGWLLGTTMSDAGAAMKIKKLTPDGHDSFLVTFESGLCLRVAITEAVKRSDVPR